MFRPGVRRRSLSPPLRRRGSLRRLLPGDRGAPVRAGPILVGDLPVGLRVLRRRPGPPGPDPPPLRPGLPGPLPPLRRPYPPAPRDLRGGPGSGLGAPRLAFRPPLPPDPRPVPLRPGPVPRPDGPGVRLHLRPAGGRHPGPGAGPAPPRGGPRPAGRSRRGRRGLGRPGGGHPGQPRGHGLGRRPAHAGFRGLPGVEGGPSGPLRRLRRGGRLGGDPAPPRQGQEKGPDPPGALPRPGAVGALLLGNRVLDWFGFASSWPWG